MSSRYPILDNRPIDQWKVTELKEELKRRKLTIKGLKDDLIRRLDEALRIERENAEKDADNGFNLDQETATGVKNAETMVNVIEIGEDTVKDAANKNEKADNIKVQVDINDSVETMDHEQLQENAATFGINSSRVEEELTDTTTTVETSITVTESVVDEVPLIEQDLSLRKQNVSANSNMQLDNEDSKPQPENKGLKPPHKDVVLDSSAPTNQVSEVSPILGFQVKSDSISTDSVSINEKIELKDNIIADNVKLELDVVKPDMVEPPSSNIVPVGGESHPMDVEEPQETKLIVEEKNDSNATNADISKKNDSADVGYSEKLNLDRSSGDDSMEEDVLESKQIDSKYNSNEVEDKSEKGEVPVSKETNIVDVVGNQLSTDQKVIHAENKIRQTATAEKRKLSDQEAVGNTEPLKRQRRWNSESLKVPEPQSYNLTPRTTPKDATTPLRRNFSRSDSTASEEAPKERVVPPSQKPATNSLRIDRFVRPFTLKAVQELLGKTGEVTSFWMDHIKTHCYVTYSSVEEAAETRSAVYNLQWPPNGGRLLVAEFVDPQEVKMRVEAPPQSPATPVTPNASAPVPPALQAQPSPRQQVSRQQLPPPPPPPLSNPSLARERLAHVPQPVLPDKPEPPIVTLDDLFRKTKATPRIYYLPLAEEQVAAKVAEREKNTKQ